MPLKVVASTRDFVANCDADDYSRQELLLGASWLPVPTMTPAVAARSGTIFFRTADALIAGNLVGFMDLPTAKKLALATKAGMKHLRNSRSQKVPRTSTWPCLQASTTWASRKAASPRS